jgi:Maf1 regulator
LLRKKKNKNKKNKKNVATTYRYEPCCGKAKTAAGGERFFLFLIMKYLHDDVLAALSSKLMDCPMLDNGERSNSRILHGRIEAYTTKRTHQEKDYAVHLLERYVEAQESNEQMTLLAMLRNNNNNDSNNNGDNSRTNNNNNKTMKNKRRRSQSTSEAEAADVHERSSSSTSWAAAGGQPGIRRLRSLSLDEKSHQKAPSYSTGVLPKSSSLSMSRAFVATSAVPTATTTTTPSLLQQQSQSRRLWTDLILTLNLSFPDFDFTDNATSQCFTAIPLRQAVAAINQKIGDNTMLRCNFWPAIDNVVGPLSQITTVYSFIDTEDILKSKLLPSSNNNNNNTINGGGNKEQVIWSVNYFFVNKVAKRIVFFTCIETMRPVETMQRPSRLFGDDDDEMVGGGDEVGEDEEDNSESVSNFDMDPSMSAGGFPIG